MGSDGEEGDAEPVSTVGWIHSAQRLDSKVK